VVSDEDIMSKAQRLAAKRNLEYGEVSFASFKPKINTFNLNKVGIRLGINTYEISNSVVSIKNIEIDRLKAAAKSRPHVPSLVLDEDEEDEVDTIISHVTNCWDENTNLGGLDLCCDLSTVLHRKNLIV
jgi:hypothetical protein